MDPMWDPSGCLFVWDLFGGCWPQRRTSATSAEAGTLCVALQMAVGAEAQLGRQELSVGVWVCGCKLG